LFQKLVTFSENILCFLQLLHKYFEIFTKYVVTASTFVISIHLSQWSSTFYVTHSRDSYDIRSSQHARHKRYLQFILPSSALSL